MKSQKRKPHIIPENRETNNREVQDDIRLDEKRCLTIKEFQIYFSIGRNNALKLARQSGAVIRIGKKMLVDRVAFDRWLDEQRNGQTEEEFRC